MFYFLSEELLMLTKSCPRCRGYLHTSRDIYGGYRECLQCGYMEDAPSPEDRRVPRVRVPEKDVA